MLSEIDFQTAAQHHQKTLLAEANMRRLTRVSREQPTEPQPSTRRLHALLRRIAGVPTFA